MTLRDLWDVVPRNHMFVHITKGTANWQAVVRGEEEGAWVKVTDGRDGPILLGREDYADWTVLDVSTDNYPNYGTVIKVVIT